MTLVEARPKAAGGAAACMDGPWELPEGWAWAPLKLLCSFIGRGRGPTYVSTSGVPVVNQKCVRWHRLERQHLKLTAREAYERLPPELHLKIGDILWNSTGTGTIGRALVYDGSFPELTVDSHVTIVRPNSVEAKFLGYLIETTHVQHLVVDGHVGSTNQQELPRSFVEGLPIPLAPLAEQRRIVARIDELFAEIAGGEAALREARKGLDLFRRALLKAAVTGELTKDWRDANRSDETGQHLLARIRAERKVAVPAKVGSRRVENSTELGSTSLPELPKGWAWTTLGETADSVRNGTSAAPRANANGHEILRISSVRPLFIDESQIRYLDNDQLAQASDAFVEAGDLLFTRYNGSADLVGVGAVYRGRKRYYPDKIIRVRLNSLLEQHTSFVELAVNTWVCRKHIASNIKTTAGQQGLSGASLKDTPLPIPPSAETAEILRRVSDALSAVDEAAALLDAEAADAARLRQSILKAAFEGRLVPQNPADEPASSWLRSLVEAPSDPIIRKRGRPRKAS